MTRHRAVLSTCGVWLTVVALVPAAHAQEDAFRAGIEAKNSKKWQEAATQMRRAIQADPKESTKKVRPRLLGIGLPGGGTEYLPHYFLGEALFNLNDCPGAVDAWAKSEQQGVVKVRPDLVTSIQNGYASCDERGVLPPSKYEPVLARTTQQITDASGLAGTVSKLGEANADLWRPEMREQYDRAFNEIQAARSHRDTATRTRATRDFNEVSAATERARAVLVALSANLNAEIEGQKSFQKQASDIEQIIGNAESSDRVIDGKKTSLTQALAAVRQNGRDAMNRARERLTAAVRTSNSSFLEEARTQAQDASARLRQVLDELARVEKGDLDQKLAAAKAAAQETLSFVDRGFVTFDRLAGQKPASVRPEMTAERDAIERQITTTRRRLDAAVKGENPAAIQAATKLASDARDRLNVLITSFGPLTIIDRGVHPALELGARSFFAGEYQQVLAVLSPAEGFAPDIPLQLHIHLFRAAALYQLFVRSRETDQSLLTKASAEVEQCKQLNPAFLPDPRAFAPRFIAFFQGEDAPRNQPASAPPSQR